MRKFTKFCLAVLKSLLSMAINASSNRKVALSDELEREGFKEFA